MSVYVCIYMCVLAGARAAGAPQVGYPAAVPGQHSEPGGRALCARVRERMRESESERERELVYRLGLCESE